jgi:hypothetical protein
MEASKEKIERKNECIDIEKKGKCGRKKCIKWKVPKSKIKVRYRGQSKVSKGTSRGEIKDRCRRGEVVEGIG